MERYKLTRTEARIAVELAEGKTYREIAETLGISFQTVKGHVKHVLRKTKAGSSRKLAALVHRESQSRGE